MKSNIKFVALCLLGLTLNSNISFAQSDVKSSAFNKAQKEYKALRYSLAIPLLNQVLKAQPNNVEALAMLADANRKVKNYTEAEVNYAKLLKEASPKPEWTLAYAEVLANNEKYDQSEAWYKKYLALANNDSRGVAFSKAYPNVASFMQNKTNWKIGYANINTSQSDYAPAYYKDGLLFVSNRKSSQIVKNVFAWDATPFSDLYYVDQLNKIEQVNIDSVLLAAKTDKKLKAKAYRINNDDTRRTSNDSPTFGDALPVLNDTIAKALGVDKLTKTLRGSVNTKYHEGPVALLPDGTLLFTRNNYYKGKTNKSSEGIIKLKMYTANAKDLDNVKPLAFNNDEYSVGHPTVNKEGTVLIFTSDMPGGFGGTDLYYSTRSSVNDEWAKPVNLGKAVNTEGDEMFPNLSQNNTLFFASNGHPGLGGLDIFQIAIDGTHIKGMPANLGAPINSSVDDFALIRSEDGKSGFFSSNRRGNDDIYSFIYDKRYNIILQGILVDNSTKKPMANQSLVINYLGEDITLTTDSQGKYSYQMPKNATVSVVAKPNGYVAQTKSISSLKITKDTVLVYDFGLNKIDDKSTPQIAKKIDCDSVRKAAKEFVLYYDLDQYRIRKDAAEVADKIAIFLKQNPQYEVHAASYTDSRASKEYNLKLSANRAESAKKYLVNKGINANRITLTHFGEENLVNFCTDGVECTEEQQQLNRRTEFILKYQGKRVSELDCDTINKLHP